MLASSVQLFLALLFWPITLALGQASLTPPPITDPGSQSSVSSLPSITPSASVTSPSANASESLTPSLSSSAMFPSLSGYSSCVVQCLSLTVSNAGCHSVVEVQCFCNNTGVFTSGLVDCISQQCPSDLSAAESISQQFCNVASPSVSLSFPTPSLSPSSSQQSSSSVSGSLSSSGLLSNASRTNIPTPTVSQTGAPNGARSVDGPSGIGGVVVIGLALGAYSLVLGW
ncbi:hypothetical protein NLI96_g724 [Meripilus lineatus]|uniref:CFEM domain-containing protein n=1 Tax=Meripilus lineatus TaxID=2056292 RepID=A0AAD5VED0_9APHY|nr:hypothetical protein NLI96_g724 [Physisporinus lineatus]